MTTRSIKSNSGKDILIRPLQFSDVDILLEFINTLAKEDIYLNANPQNLYSYQQEQAYVSDCLNKIKYNLHLHLLAFHNNILVGATTITKQASRQNHIGLFGITIAKEYRGDGIGVNLSKIAIEQSKELNISMIILDAFSKNQPALNLYKKIGFKEYGFLPQGFSYQNHYEDKVLMYKLISEDK